LRFFTGFFSVSLLSSGAGEGDVEGLLSRESRDHIGLVTDSGEPTEFSYETKLCGVVGKSAVVAMCAVKSMRNRGCVEDEVQ